MKKLVGSFLAILMALTFVTTALAAVQLKDYPGFLATKTATTSSIEGVYVVVGDTAAASDIVGAVDLAIRLAEHSYTIETLPGVPAAVTGIEKNTIDPRFGNLTDVFPNPIRTFHYPGLKQGQITWKGGNYDYHEQINLSAATSKVYFSHDFGTVGINGTETMVVPASAITYEYVFDKTLNLSSASGKGTLADPEYTYPIDINLLGQPFSIVGIGSNQVKMLVASRGMATATQGVTYGDYTVYAILGGTNFVRVSVRDKAGNTVEELLISNVPNSVDTTKTTPILTIKCTSVAALVDGTVVGAYLVVGPQGAIEKTYTTSCDITGTGVADVKFPGTEKWCIQVVGFATSGHATAGDKIQVIYKPTIQPEYYKAGEKLALPRDYGEIGFRGWNYDTWATLTFKPVAGLSGYCLIGAGTTNSTVCASNLNGIEITSDVAGTIVYGATGYSKAYILFGAATDDADYKYPVYMGLWDSINNRIGVDPTNTHAIYKALNSSVGSNDYVTLTFTISYGGGAATSDQQTLFANVSVAEAAVLATGGTAKSIFREFKLNSTTPAVNKAVSLNFYNKTAWTAAAPEFRLFESDSVEAKDVQIVSTDTSGAAQTADAGAATQDVVTDGGTIVLSPASNGAAQIIKVKVPAMALYVKAYVGKLGTEVAGETYKKIVAVKTPISKLASEAQALKATSHLILVGGPCANSLVAELAAAGKLKDKEGNALTCDAWVRAREPKGIITAIEDAFATGKIAVVVAGLEAEDTRAATATLQKYEDFLSAITTSSVETGGTVIAPAMPTPY
ncbi:MAG: S-layer protein [Candidatus Aenigmarchaeota archaeon]|nr:S-layer protein [Candidatus Aenigmarchaeota archaeon]